MNIYARKRGGTWSVNAVLFVNGKRVDRWLKTDVPCNDTDSKGRQKALRIGREWAEGIEEMMTAAGVAATRSLHEYCVNHIDSLVTMGQIEGSTRRGYNTYLNYIRDYFGEKTILDVTTSDVEGYLVWLREEKGLCANSTKKAYNVLKGCMRHAVIARELRWNPCDAIQAPKQEKVAPNPLTERSRATFVEHMADLPLTPEVMGIWICYYTGCRRGEAAHLRWRDIAWGKGCGASFATINGSIGDRKGGTYEKSTKSGRDRVVPLPPSLVSLLQKRKSAMVDECIYAGIAFDANLFVCGEIDGRWLRPERLTKWWNSHRTEWQLMGVQGRPPVLHDLRHTYATIAVRNMDPKTAQSILGHSDINMTMAYAATDLSHIAAAGSAMGGVLG